MMTPSQDPSPRKTGLDLIRSLFPTERPGIDLQALKAQIGEESRDSYAAERTSENARVKAAEVCGTVYAFLRNEHHKEAALIRHLDAAQNQRHSIHGLQHFLAQADAIVTEHVNDNPVFEFAFRLYELAPALAHYRRHSEKSEAEQTLQMRYNDAIESGRMHEYCAPQPDVEAWIAHYSSAFQRAFSESFTALNAHTIFSAMLGLEPYLACLTGRLWRHFYDADSTRPGEKITSLVVEALETVMLSLRAAALRDILAQPKCMACRGELAALYDSFCERSIRPERISKRTRFDYVKRVVHIFAAERRQIAAAFTLADHQFEMASLAADLTTSGLFRPRPAAEREQMARRAVPFGQLLIIDQRTEPLILFYADGVGHQSKILHRLPAGHKLHSLSFDGGFPCGDHFEMDGFACAALDDNGKLYTSWNDRLIPPPGEAWADAEAIYRGALDHYSNIVYDLWVRFSKFFNTLKENGPYVISLSPDGSAYLAVRESAADNLSSAGASLPDVEGDMTVPKGIYFTNDDRWCFMQLYGSSAAASAESQPEVNYLDLLRRRLGDKAPSYRWLRRSLKPFGVTEDLSDGHGSHGSLLRQTETLKRRQGTWHALRKGKAPVDFPFLLEMFDKLEITPEEYYKSLVQRKLI